MTATPPGPGTTNTRTLLTLVAIFIAVALLWDTMLVTPLKIVVVLLHELSHGMAAVITGGSIDHIEVNAQQGGVCWTSGGNRFLTLTAGYLGSMTWGGLILVGASRTRFDRHMSAAIGLFVVVMTVFYVRNMFGFVFSLGFGLAMLAISRWMSEQFNDLLLKVIGLTSCLYAILDIVDDVLKRPGIGSDADMLAELTHIPTLVWGVVWVVAAVAVAAVFLKLSSPGESAVRR